MLNISCLRSGSNASDHDGMPASAVGRASGWNSKGYGLSGRGMKIIALMILILYISPVVGAEESISASVTPSVGSYDFTTYVYEFVSKDAPINEVNLEIHPPDGVDYITNEGEPVLKKELSYNELQEVTMGLNGKDNNNIYNNMKKYFHSDSKNAPWELFGTWRYRFKINGGELSKYEEGPQIVLDWAPPIWENGTFSDKPIWRSNLNLKTITLSIFTSTSDIFINLYSWNNTTGERKCGIIKYSDVSDKTNDWVNVKFDVSRASWLDEKFFENYPKASNIVLRIDRIDNANR